MNCVQQLSFKDGSMMLPLTLHWLGFTTRPRVAAREPGKFSLYFRLLKIRVLLWEKKRKDPGTAGFPIVDWFVATASAGVGCTWGTELGAWLRGVCVQDFILPSPGRWSFSGK